VFNILWISGVGLVSMWALKLTFEDVFSLGAKRDAARDEVPEAAGAAS
jgi:hypothetical protein